MATQCTIGDTPYLLYVQGSFKQHEAEVKLLQSLVCSALSSLALDTVV